MRIAASANGLAKAMAIILAVATVACLGNAPRAQPAPSGNLVVSDYKDADDASGVLEEMWRRSEGRILFVLFHHPACEDCRGTVEHFTAAKPKSPVDYQLLRVNIEDYRKAWRVYAQQGARVPLIYFMPDKPPYRALVRAPASVEEVLKVVEAIRKLPPAPTKP
jgi:hypothetical protein